MSSSSWASASNGYQLRGDSTRSRAAGLDEFARWVESLMRLRGYGIDSPRSGGKSRLADAAGVHRAAVSRLLHRQSMPDLETMRRLAAVLDVPLRDMLIRSGRVSEEDLPVSAAPAAPETATEASPMSPHEAAQRMGVPPELQDTFVRVARQFLSEAGDQQPRWGRVNGTY